MVSSILIWIQCIIICTFIFLLIKIYVRFYWDSLTMNRYRTSLKINRKKLLKFDFLKPPRKYIKSYFVNIYLLNPLKLSSISFFCLFNNMTCTIHIHLFFTIQYMYYFNLFLSAVISSSICIQLCIVYRKKAMYILRSLFMITSQ